MRIDLQGKDSATTVLLHLTGLRHLDLIIVSLRLKLRYHELATVPVHPAAICVLGKDGWGYSGIRGKGEGKGHLSIDDFS